ncbi:hypothetical protein JQ580_26705 [Bradyrhizobium japonicum]|nr:hypothetical protein [Bradyrhizobium japonicum]
MVGLCNKSREVFPTPEGTTNAIAAVSAIDIDRGADMLRPRYAVVEELVENEDGYFVFQVDDAVDVDGDFDVLSKAIAEASRTCVKATYTL